MPTVQYETTIAAPLERVWAFHEDILGALPALSPPKAQVRVESADLPARVGTKVVLTAKAPLRGRVRWVAVYTTHEPPHAVVFGEEARFVDEQESGPFKFWRHEHEFERLDAKSTRMVDRITYKVPFGPIGWLADVLVIRRTLDAMFKHRHAATKRALE
jgi:ligand-binding SRPBCC domain-containing protein